MDDLRRTGWIGGHDRRQPDGGNAVSRTHVARDAAFLLAAAVLATPLDARLAAGPVELTLTDAFMLLACLRQTLHLLAAHSRRDVRSIAQVVPFLAAAVLAASAGRNHMGAAKNLAQLLVYAGAGSWLAWGAASDPTQRRRLAGAVVGASAFALAGLALLATPWGAIVAPYLGHRHNLAGSAMLLAGAACAAEARYGWRTRAGLVAMALTALLVIVLPGPQPNPTAERVPQRYLEAHAAIGAATEHPLLGVGLADYQERIGEFYGGMPKDNTMAPGSQIGWGVLPASMGLLGLGAFLFWMGAIGKRLRVRSNMAAAAALLAVLAGGALTTFLVARMLLPLALIHGFAMAETRND
jgi:hypothetical protein